MDVIIYYYIDMNNNKRYKKMAKLNTSKIGTIGELIGSAWLAAKGYTVHRNTEPNGPIDLIAEKDGMVLFIDVKVMAGRMNGTAKNGYGSKSASREDVSILYVHLGQMRCRFKGTKQKPIAIWTSIKDELQASAKDELVTFLDAVYSNK